MQDDIELIPGSLVISASHRPSKSHRRRWSNRDKSLKSPAELVPRLWRGFYRRHRLHGWFGRLGARWNGTQSRCGRLAIGLWHTIWGSVSGNICKLRGLLRGLASVTLLKPFQEFFPGNLAALIRIQSLESFLKIISGPIFLADVLREAKDRCGIRVLAQGQDKLPLVDRPVVVAVDAVENAPSGGQEGLMIRITSPASPRNNSDRAKTSLAAARVVSHPAWNIR
mmetsp:Transcript_93968/g.214938  ORF Transcript_93968/g.214938 Transcript_93968/m.214938 type:complete len:225 (-) Transcript_93968:787-1461(-)